jgi:hypothetical protein
VPKVQIQEAEVLLRPGQRLQVIEIIGNRIVTELVP